nr:MAG TPA: hypothetical protein [Caudoviricetes sp.]
MANNQYTAFSTFLLFFTLSINYYTPPPDIVVELTSQHYQITEPFALLN